MSEAKIEIEDIKNLLRGKAQQPILYVKSVDDPSYKTMRDMALRIYPETEDSVWSISGAMRKMFDTLRHMEEDDYNKVINTIKKYEVKGEMGAYTGQRTYGYDISRVDRKLIRRKRGN
tara:strand:+ start:108 stop:461 length:354 start_codon:yes stop_codon:yes gene_type:complete